VNLSAYAHLARLVIPHMQAVGTGRIVNVASTEAIVATAGLAAYTAAKHGVVGLTKSLAAELGRHGINVNTICPGPISTAMTAAIPDDAKAIYAKRRVPLRRYGDPEEVAQMTLSACLPAASFLNGATIVVDGGMVATTTAETNEVPSPTAAAQSDDEQLDIWDSGTDSFDGVDEPVEAPAATEDSTSKKPASKRKGGRASIPSWDEILLGTQSPE
ncbi:MAG: SDR family oxidoreductase, partial [Actinobacteria bacterium]|nr:SDR family oxidoreductase [Actinomycetota bacterium]